MKKKVKEFLINVWDEIEYGLRLLCGKPTPMKRFIIVLVIGGSLSIAFIHSIVSSIYNIGKRDAERIYIEQLELKDENDSINLLKQNMYDYEQSSE